MRFIVTILLFISMPAFAQQKFFMLQKRFDSVTVAQFNLSWTTSNEYDWISVIGDPNTSILTANDSRSGSTITISTIATGNTYWTGNGTAAAGYVTEVDANGRFPAELGSGYYFHQSTTPPSGGNIRLSGFLTTGIYQIQVGSNRPTVTDNRLTAIACIDNVGTETFRVVNSAPSTTEINEAKSQVVSAGTVITFTNKIPNGSGEIFLSVAAATGNTFGYINYIRIVRIK